MPRKLRIAAVGLGLVAMLVAAFLGGAFYATRQVRPFYKQALLVQPEVQVRESRELESRATALYSTARQHGQWQALFTAEQINGWLATQMAQNDDRTLPANIRDPRVEISDDAFTLGFSTTSGGVDTVVTVDASVFLTEDGAVAVELMAVRAGALPLPILRLADELAAACQQLSLPVRWTQQDGKPVALIELARDAAADKPQFHIDCVELSDSQLYVAGHTELTGQPGDTLPIGSADRSRPEIALDDYELRLAPRGNNAALQVARRRAADTEPADSKAAR